MFALSIKQGDGPPVNQKLHQKSTPLPVTGRYTLSCVCLPGAEVTLPNISNLQMPDAL